MANGRFNKAKAYVVALLMIFSFMPVSVALLWFDKLSAEQLPFGGVLAAIVSLTTTFFTLNVVDNGVKGKNYRAELDENNPHRYDEEKK